MAHKKEKEEAISLFKQGFEPPEVSEKLGIHLRNCQRWFKEFRKNVVSLSDKKEADKPECKQIEPGQEHQITALSVSDWDGNWLDAAKKLMSEQLIAHSMLRRKMQELLRDELESNEINIRKISGLSAAICKHSDLEFKYAAIDLLEPNKAFELILKMGYVIMIEDGGGNTIEAPPFHAL